MNFKTWMENKEYPWRIWSDGLTQKTAKKLLAHYQKKQPVPDQVYEFRIATTEFHGEGLWRLEGRRIQ